MRIVICWATISGYMAACWRELAARDGVELFVIAHRPSSASSAFNDELMHGINCELVDANQSIGQAHLSQIVSSHKPDVVVVNGWHKPAYRRLPLTPEFAQTQFIMAMDTPWLGTMRQRLGRFRHPRYFSRINSVFVTGERCYSLARALGFREGQIHRGVYGVDFRTLSPLHARRCSLEGGCPRSFISTGQYIERKGIRTLLAAYAQYRSTVTNPWSMTFCGKGPLQDDIRAAEGVEDRGFVQPSEIPEVLLHHSAFVLASTFDPWPLVIVEACAAGLPIVCTDSCGSHVELVRPCFNGRTVETGDVDGLARALLWVHQNEPRLQEMGVASQNLASAYSAEMWAQRWLTVCRELIG